MSEYKMDSLFFDVLKEIFNYTYAVNFEESFTNFVMEYTVVFEKLNNEYLFDEFINLLKECLTFTATCKMFALKLKLKKMFKKIKRGLNDHQKKVIIEAVLLAYRDYEDKNNIVCKTPIAFDQNQESNCEYETVAVKHLRSVPESILKLIDIYMKEKYPDDMGLTATRVYNFVETMFRETIGLKFYVKDKNKFCKLNSKLAKFKAVDITKTIDKIQSIERYIKLHNSINSINEMKWMQNIFDLLNSSSSVEKLDWKCFLPKPLSIIDLSKIQDISDYYAEYKLDGNRVFLARGCCSRRYYNQVHSNHLGLKKNLPCHWVILDQHMKPLKYKYEFLKFACENKSYHGILAGFLDSNEHLVSCYQNLQTILNSIECRYKELYGEDTQHELDTNDERDKNIHELHNTLLSSMFCVNFPVLSNVIPVKNSLFFYGDRLDGVFGTFPTLQCIKNSDIIERYRKVNIDKSEYCETNGICSHPAIILEANLTHYVYSRFKQNAQKSYIDGLFSMTVPYMEARDNIGPDSERILYLTDIWQLGKWSLHKTPYSVRRNILEQLKGEAFKVVINEAKRLSCVNDAYEMLKIMKNKLHAGIVLKHKDSTLSSWHFDCSVKYEPRFDLLLLGIGYRSDGCIGKLYFGVKVGQYDKFILNSLSRSISRNFEYAILLEFDVDVELYCYVSPKFLDTIKLEHRKYDKLALLFTTPKMYTILDSTLKVWEFSGEIKIEGRNANNIDHLPAGMFIEKSIFRKVRKDKYYTEANDLKDLFIMQNNCMQLSHFI